MQRSARKLAVVAVAATVAGLVLGVGQASALQRDPDRPASVMPISVIGQLLAPAITIGDTDLTPVGVGTESTGVGYSLAAASASTAAPTSNPPHTFWVDDVLGSKDCKQATFTSIQAAVDASGPKDKVKVCPGTYLEQVEVTGHNHDGLSIESVKPLQAIVKWPATENGTYALVDFNNVDDATIQRFTLTGPWTFGGCSEPRHEGVLVEGGASDIRIHENHITLIQNSDPALYGCQEGDAVSIGRREPFATACDMAPASPGSAHVDHNLIDEYQKNGVQVTQTGSSAKVDHNDVVGSSNPGIQSAIASNGILVFCGASGDVDHNNVSALHYTPFPLTTGIGLAQAPPGTSSVDHNRVFDNDYGVESDTQDDAELTHNDIYDNTADGLYLCGDAAFFCGPATQIVVRDNKVRDNAGSGVVLYDADSNLVKSNDSDRNGTPGGDTTDGMRMDNGSMNNQIRDNHMDDNVDHDCHDQQAPSNTWSGNKGETSFPLGLCKK